MAASDAGLGWFSTAPTPDDARVALLRDCVLRATRAAVTTNRAGLYSVHQATLGETLTGGLLPGPHRVSEEELTRELGDDGRLRLVPDTRDIARNRCGPPARGASGDCGHAH